MTSLTFPGNVLFTGTVTSPQFVSSQQVLAPIAAGTTSTLSALQIGVNTTTPAFTLDVIGQSRNTATKFIGNGPTSNLNGASTAGLVLTSTTSSTLSAPHISVYASNSTYPIFQQLNWASDNVALNFDSYYDGTNLRTSGTVTAFQIYKNNGILRFNAAASLGVGSTTSSITAISINNAGQVGINNISPAYNLDVSGTARTTGQTILANAFNIIPGTYVNASGVPTAGANCMLLDLPATGTVTFWDTVDIVGSLGINTPSPAYNLDISGTFRNTGALISGSITSPYGSISTSAYCATLTVGTLLNFVSSGTVGTNLSLSGTLTAASSTSPYGSISTSAYCATLTVGTLLNFVSGSGTVGTNLSLTGTLTAASITSPYGSISTSAYCATLTVGTLLNFVSGSGTIGTNLSLTGTLTAANVGINTTTPAFPLDVSGQGRFTSNAAAQVTVKNTSTGNVRDACEVFFDRSSGTATAISAIGVGAGGRGAYWWVNGNDSINVNSTGQVGIGNIIPAYAFDVNGASRFNQTIYGNVGTNASALLLDNGAILSAKNSTGASETFMYPRWTDNVTYLQYGSGGMNIRSNSSVNTMYLTNSNQVGINNVNPAYSLDVTGTTRFSASTVASSTIPLMATTGTWSVNVLPRAQAGNFNGLVAADDSLLYCTQGTNGTGNFVIGPWSPNPYGIKITSAGNVGINTISPVFPLDVAGAHRNTGTKFIGNGPTSGLSGASIAGLVLTSTTSSTLSAPHVSVYTNNATYPIFQQLNWSSDNVALNFDCYYDTTFRTSSSSGVNAYSIYKFGGLLRLCALPSTGIGSASSTITALAINGSGQVGINNINPVAALDVVGSIKSAGSLSVSSPTDYPVNIINNLSNGVNSYSRATSAVSPNMSSGEAFLMQLGLNSSLNNGGYFGYVYSGTSSSPANYLSMGLYSTDRIVNITGNRNVGINTTTPAYSLDVTGAVRCVTANTVSMLVQVGSSTSNGIALQIAGTNGAQDIGIGFQQTGVNSYGIVQRAGTGGRLSFVQNMYPGNAGTEQVTILQNGNVGISTISPAYTLDVSGTTRITPTTAGPALLVVNPSLQTGNQNYIAFGSNTAVAAGCAYLNYFTGTTVTASTSWGLFGQSTDAVRVAASGTGYLVGVNTSSPAFTLDVAGQGNFSNGLFTNGLTVYQPTGKVTTFIGPGGAGSQVNIDWTTFPYGTSTTVNGPAVRWQLTDLGNFQDTVNLMTNASASSVTSLVSRLFINVAGQVGINNPGPAYLLDVGTTSSPITNAKFGGSLPIYLINSYPFIGFNAQYTNNWITGTCSGNNYSAIAGLNPANGLFTINVSNTATITGVAQNFGTALSVTSNAVGVNTASPAYPLDVTGTIRANGTAGQFIVGDTLPDGSNRAIIADYSTMAANTAKYITVGQSQSTLNQAEVSFNYVGSGNSANSATLGLFGSAAKLNVVGYGTVSLSAAGPAVFQLQPSGGGGSITQMQFYQFTGQQGCGCQINTIDDSNYSAHLSFLTKTPGSGAQTLNERFRIQSNGQAYLYNNNTGTLVIGGSTTITGANGLLQVYNVPNARAAISSYVGATNPQNHIEFFSPQQTGFIGYISSNGASTSYNTSSDYRLKHQVQNLEGHDIVQRLRPVTFLFDKDDQRRAGFLAHEAQAIVPEAVTGMKDAVNECGEPVYQGVDYSKFVPHLTSAIQSLVQKNAEANKLITNLQDDNSLLKQQVMSIEARLARLESNENADDDKPRQQC